ncbi:MAG: ERF family protein [Pseudomonadota bacterium]
MVDTTAIARIEPEANVPAPSYDDLELTFEQRLILDPTIDLDRVQKVYDMRKDAEREEARRQFVDAKKLLQNEMPIVQRKSNNSHTKSTYADLAAIDEKLKPLMFKYGFTTDFTATKSEMPGHMDCTLKVSHTAGYFEEFELPWPIDDAGTNGTKNKTGVQGMKSTLTFARRAMKVGYFDIADSDEDGNNTGESFSGITLNEEQIAWIDGKLKELDRDVDVFLSWCSTKGFGATEVANLPVEKFEFIEAQINHWSRSSAKSPA